MTALALTPAPTTIVELELPRLPYDEDITHRFGIDRGGWRVLVEAVFPSAKSFDAIVMALSYCKARNLDVFKKPVHIVPMWSSQKRGYVETIWPSIAELRTTAFRTGNYAGCDSAEFGPTIEKTFSGKVKKYRGREEYYEDAEITVTFPEWCRITIYRELSGRICKFVGPKVVWLESYATIGKTSIPNEMWQERPEGQLEKCGEAAALRRAFPEEIGNEYAAEEMEGRRVYENREVPAPRRDDDDTPPAPPPAQTAPAPAQITQQETVRAPAMAPITTAASQPSYVDLVEGGRDNGQQVIWGDDDEPPNPASRQEPRQPSHGATGKASPAANPTPVSQQAAVEDDVPFASKAQLLAEIGKLESLAAATAWSTGFRSEDIGNLDGADRREVDDAFNRKTAELEKKKK